jgi:hypothetical protein
MRGAAGYGRAARSDLVDSTRRRNSREGSTGDLIGSQRSLLQEDHIAEEMANGKVGSLNQCGRYCKGAATLSEQPIRRGQPWRGDTQVDE